MNNKTMDLGKRLILSVIWTFLMGNRQIEEYLQLYFYHRSNLEFYRYTLMLQEHQQTQGELVKTHLHTIQSLNQEIIIKGNNKNQENLHQYTKQSGGKNQKQQVSIKTKTKVAKQPLKQTTNVKKQVQTNVIKIRPKGQAIQTTKQNPLEAQTVEVHVSPTHAQQKSKKATIAKTSTSENRTEHKTQIQSLKTSKMLTNPKDFLMKPVSEQEVTRLKILRVAHLFSNQLFILLKGQPKKLIQIQKQFKLFGNKVHFRIPTEISNTDSQKSEVHFHNEKEFIPELGEMESNFDGSIFNVYETNPHTHVNQLVATIQYLTSTCNSGGPRQVKLYFLDHTIETVLVHRKNDENLKDYYLKNPGNSAVQCLQTVQPRYDKQANSYYLHFETKKKPAPSIHNLILVNGDHKPALKFYKAQQRQYQLQCFYPLTPLIGCAYVMSSFIFKWATQ